MLIIRFHREGKKKSPTYRIVVTESSRPAQGKYLEKLGSYNPKSKAAQLNAERILHWLSKGAQVSPTVHNLLVKHGVIQAKKIAKHAKKKGKEEVVAAPTPESVSVDTTGEAGIE
ncbi:30S ribosomal protein S16 [Candidatus Azambacteria bacterium]|nr:30S ribosomal protein S16 [Candidatus Azambacteria bacterium]MBI2587791.1 30S ribosomal protein S16 [Candidatus Azambacteria bacterium]